MTTMSDLMLIEPVADATPHKTLECLMAWLREASPTLYDKAAMNSVSLGHVIDEVSCDIVIDGTVSEAGSQLLRMDYRRLPIAFVFMKILPRGLNYGYRVMALQGGGTDVLLDEVRDALLKLDKGSLKRAYLHDDMSEFLGELTP